MAVVCPKCYPDGWAYAGPITWRLCRNCAREESQEFGVGLFDDKENR